MVGHATWNRPAMSPAVMPSRKCTVMRICRRDAWASAAQMASMSSRRLRASADNYVSGSSDAMAMGDCVPLYPSMMLPIGSQTAITSGSWCAVRGAFSSIHE